MEWLEPWVPIGELDWPEEKRAEYCRAWESQLQREVGPQHVLFGKDAILIARRFDCDDALFQISDGRVADVHLTWSKGAEPDPLWPNTQVFEGLDGWSSAVMKAAHDDWQT